MWAIIRRRLKACRFLVRLVEAFREIPHDLQVLLWVLRRRSQTTAYFRDRKSGKLQIGTGHNPLGGWLNTDLHPGDRSIVYLDAAKDFPFASSSFQYVFSEHVIEHLTFENGARMLAECHRVLVPGGKIRIATPNLSQIASLVIHPEGDAEAEYLKRASEKYLPGNHARLAAPVVNNFYWGFGHFFLYDPPSLANSLESAGFTAIHPASHGESKDPDLCRCEQHGDIIGSEMNRYETMILEATKDAG